MLLGVIPIREAESSRSKIAPKKRGFSRCFHFAQYHKLAFSSKDERGAKGRMAKCDIVQSMLFGPKKLPFDYTTRVSKRSRSLRISVKHDGSVVVTVPPFMPDMIVHRFVAKHAEWIETKLEDFKKHPAPLLSKLSRREYVKHKEAARALAHERIAHWNAYYTFPIRSVRIGNQKSRWGSCSAGKNLNFNYKIVLLPKELSDYVIVHELCHLKELNHSPRFWNLVAEQIPNWKKLRKELKKY